MTGVGGVRIPSSLVAETWEPTYFFIIKTSRSHPHTQPGLQWRR